MPAAAAATIARPALTGRIADAVRRGHVLVVAPAGSSGCPAEYHVFSPTWWW